MRRDTLEPKTNDAEIDTEFGLVSRLVAFGKSENCRRNLLRMNLATSASQEHAALCLS